MPGIFFPGKAQAVNMSRCVFIPALGWTGLWINCLRENEIRNVLWLINNKMSARF